MDEEIEKRVKQNENDITNVMLENMDLDRRVAKLENGGNKHG